MELNDPLEPVTTAGFQRKAVSVAELPDSTASLAEERFAVAKVIELTSEQYRYFSTHLLEDMPFIAENTELAGFDEQRRRKVLMITIPERHSCLLVDTQGYDYARYTAYVSEKERVNVEGVPVERPNQKGRDAGAKGPAQKSRNPGPSR